MQLERLNRTCGKHSWSILVAVVLFAMLVSACGGSPSGEGSNLSGTVKVGSPVSLTGVAAFAGTAIQQGMQVATDEVNSTKFLGGATLQVNYGDVGASPQQAVTVARQMIEQDQVNALVGINLSGQAQSVSAVAQSSRTVLILPEAGAPGVSSTGDYITQTNLQGFTYADKVGQALKKLNVATTEILYAQDNVTIATLVHTYTDLIFPKYGIKATLKAYLGSDTDLSAGITQGMAVKVDGIGCLFVGAQGTTCLSQARSAGFKGQLWGQSGFDGGVAINAGSVADGLIFNTCWSADFPYPESKKMVQLFQAKFPGKTPSCFQAEGYDAIWLLARAVKEGNGTSRDAIHQGLLKVLARGMNGALGPITWDKDRLSHAPGAVVQVKDGKQVLFL
jgi:branched-chain amino acid transport system substrate-binding protein